MSSSIETAEDEKPDNSSTFGAVFVLYGDEPEWRSEWQWQDGCWVYLRPKGKK